MNSIDLSKTSDFSDYIVYVDESGDHGLNKIDGSYPVFVLVFTIFNIKAYIEDVVPKIQQFKFKYFGHDQSILHETDIRKDRGDFNFLKTKDLKNNFLDELTNLIESMPFTVVASVINKENYTWEDNPYHIALGFGLERIYAFLKENKQSNKQTHVIVEKRGKVEDKELELEFRRVCDGINWYKHPLPLDIVFTDKKSNSSGLQIADLIARPIGLKIIRETQPNKAYEVIKTKFRSNKNGEIKGYGLKIFP
ncbi:DUF3800 domain-containing protein [Legionella sp. km535]|uniref:DUF3800 domain-containing protein n=1 Tax=Legionella sp. km535 TaxID=2498107 RepID=UPI000F8C455D|nr:DUF3800 domain-containing protein [Legionella sp. km535]RUR14824.1 DUF3800 domain-containing protein [Legionella sp. km535]